MKTALKVVGGLIALLVFAVLGLMAWVQVTWKVDYSGVEKPAVTASTDAAVIARGEYVVHSVAHCSICHVPKEVTQKRQSGEHPAMSGGYVWEMGPMGTLHSRNITPDPQTGIGKWTDQELARAIRWGVDPKGNQLVFMTASVGAMSDEDLTAVVSYLKSTVPVKKQNTPDDVGLLAKAFAKLFNPDFRKQFQDGLKDSPPMEEPSLGRGEYLAKGPAACIGCHSPFDIMAAKISGVPYSGSPMAEPDPEDSTMEFRTPNLTPDPETGHITTWTEDGFVGRFRQGRVIKTSKMPWEAFREMTDADLRSLYRFLRSLPPTKNVIGQPYRKAGT